MSTGRRNQKARAFTLLELMLVVAIIGLLASLIVPAYTRIKAKAQSVACSGNLRQIGVAVSLAAQDNNGIYPYIETDPTNPVYQPEDNAKGLLETLEPYDMTPEGLRCARDVAGPNHFARTGSSYEWRPLLDGEPVTNPKIYTRWGLFTAPLSRIRIASDFGSVHNGRQNLLYADGHVRMF